MLNGTKNWEKFGKLVGYYFDIDNMDDANFSTRSYGVRFSGKYTTDKVTLGYAAEFSRRTDAHENPVDYDANSYRFGFSVGWKDFTSCIGYESLGGDDAQSGAMFRTPLATLHAFNGWADKFLAIPAAGLVDAFVGVKGNAGGFSWNVLHHDVQAEAGNDKFGREVDASIGAKFAKHYGVLLKSAWFDGEVNSSYDDTTKFWIQLTAGF